MKKIMYTIATVLAVFSAKAQQDLTLYFMPAVPQVSYSNVAITPEARFTLGLPGLSSTYASVSNNGFTYKELITSNQTIEELISNMPSENRGLGAVSADLLHFSFRIGKNHIFANVSERVNFMTTYPKGIFELAWYGNAAPETIGERISLDGLGFDAMHYREYAVAYSRNLSDKLTVGARFKYLYGMENIWTRSSKIGLTTDEKTYALTLDGELDVHTAGLNQAAFDNMSDANNYLFGRNNTGYAFDLGVEYKITDKLRASASITDLGSITWNDYVSNYKVRDFEVYFDGFDLKDFINTDGTTTSTSFESVADSIAGQVQIDTTFGAYKTKLPSRYMIGANYQLFKWFGVGGLWHTQLYDSEFTNSLSISANFKLKKFFQASINYSIHNRTYQNIGIGFSVNMGPVQWYTVSDNILALQAFDWKSTNTTHVRTGFNITLGRKDKEKHEKKMKEKAQEG